MREREEKRDLIQWILVAHRAGARLFQLDSRAHLKVVQKINFDLGQLEQKDVNTDKHGNTRSRVGGVVRSYAENTDVPEHLAEVFSGELGDMLNRARHLGHFDELVLVAEPHFLGKIRGQLSANVRRSVIAEVQKDYAAFSDHETLERLRDVKEIHELPARMSLSA